MYFCTLIKSFIMKKLVFLVLIFLATRVSYAGSILFDSFEYANHDGEVPVGWISDDNSWICGYLDKDHNRHAHTGSWYAHTNSTESWMFMPMNMNVQLRYRFTLWAISDGEFQLEIWAGNEANSSSMSQLLLNETVSCCSYEQYSAYIEEIADNYEYFGIHAVASSSDNILTIDDLNVDMVDKYGMLCTPANLETHLMPGTQASFYFKFTNVGYEPLTVYINPYSEYFTDIHIMANGVEAPTFPAEPNEVVEISGIATMLPNIASGSLTWIDILFTLDCGCATSMFTLWATADSDSMDEVFSEIKVYPNPSKGNVTIEGNGNLTVTNMLGQIVLIKEIIEKETITLDKGIYFVKIGEKTEKVIVR